LSVPSATEGKIMMLARMDELCVAFSRGTLLPTHSEKKLSTLNDELGMSFNTQDMYT